MRGRDDRGSMAMALLAVMVAAILGGLLIPVVISQTSSTQFDVTRVRSLNAAQTGVDVVLGLIRDSTTTDTDDNVLGDPSKLPCYSSASPLSAAANGTGRSRYSVSVAYYVDNPTTSDRPMTCSPGYGTYDTLLHVATPHYAVITSTGTDGTVESGSTGRTLVSTYVFQTDDSSALGGQIRIYPQTGSTTKWCMDAGSATPAAATQVVLRTCSNSTPLAAQQVFAYRSDLSIQLVSSVTADQPKGLCIDTRVPAHASGLAVVLDECGVADPSRCSTITDCSPPNQQWSVDDNAHLRGASSHANTDDFCIDTPSQSDGAALSLQYCTGGTDSTQQTWIPSPTAGAGMAGAANNQLVNYREFATCLDVTGQNINADSLILYTCKQNPDPGRVLWNQKFAPSPELGSSLADLGPGPAVTQLRSRPGATYCLTSPLSNGGYPRMTSPCPPAPAAGDATTWTVNHTEDAAGNELPYAQKYTVVDSAGRCLSPGRNDDTYIGQYTKVVVAKCDGSTGQKWNAEASLDTSKLTNTHELK